MQSIGKFFHEFFYGPTRPNYIFALWLFAIGLAVYAVPFAVHGTEIDVYQGSTEYVISATPTNLSTVYYNPSVVVLRDQVAPAPVWGSTFPILITLVAGDRTSAIDVTAGVLSFEGHPVNRIALLDEDAIFCDGAEPDNDADLACVGRFVQ